MRHPIEKSPRDGTAIILEDDASGTYDVAHWSTEAGEWLGENGEPIKIAPTHWYPIPRDQYLSREDEGARDQPRSGRSQGLALRIAVTLVAAALIVTYFRAEVAGYVTRYSGQQDSRSQDSSKSMQSAGISPGCSRTRVRVTAPWLPNGRSKPVRPARQRKRSKLQRVQQIAAMPVAKAQQSLEDDRTEGRAQAATDAPPRYRGIRCAVVRGGGEERAIVGRGPRKGGRSGAGGRHRTKRAGGDYGAKSPGARRRTRARRRTGRRTSRRAARKRKAGGAVEGSGETGQQKQAEAAQRARSLEAEREKAAGLAREAAAARKELAASAEQHRQALEEERGRR